MTNSNKWKLYESALIKSIRRGQVDDALHWAKHLYSFGRAEGVWRRIFIHLSEDIGLAERNLPATIEALYQNFLRLRSSGDTAYEMSNADRLPYFHAVMLMATAKKSRAVDNALNYHYSFDPNYAQEIPDYAIDFHSPAGRRMGRDMKHWREEGSKITNESDEIQDIWKDRLPRN